MNTMITLEQLDERLEKFAERIERNLEIKMDEKVDELAGMMAREFRAIDKRFDKIEASLVGHETRITNLEYKIA